MKLLIADDEKMARLSLQSMLDELYPDEYSYEFAVDGVDMINKLDSFSPSIVLLDIKMPKLSGLEALENCRRDYPNTIFIIISGYSEFELAQNAIKLGVTDYLLKPVEIEQLQQAIERAVQQITSRDTLRQTAFEGAVYSYLADESDYEDNAELFTSVSNPFSLYYICRDGSSSANASGELLRHITGFCSKTSDSDDLYSCHYLPNGKLCLVLSTSRRITYRRFLSELISDNRFGTISIFCDEDISMQSIKAKTENLDSLSSLRCLGICDKLLECKMIPATYRTDNVIAFAKCIEEFVTAYSYSPLESKAAIRSLQSNEIFRNVFAHIPKAPFFSYFRNVTNITVTETDYNQFLQLLSLSATKTDSDDPGNSNNIITRAKQYIEENYHRGISISDVAEALSLSPAYLSRLFHCKTGEKYIDYITRVRMDAAEQLFNNNPGISAKKVAEKVGYYSVRHFKEVYSKRT